MTRVVMDVWRLAICGVVLSAVMFAVPGTGVAADIPAFPSAQGPGADTPGGRGGEVIEVTNLDDSGPGSLRAAVNAEGPRIVVFRVGGVIELESRIEIDNPYLTIAGQAAPGGGILLHDKVGPEETTGIFRIQTHDVVLRFLRLRSGLGQSGDGDNITVIDPSHHVVIDHCSMSWTNDEAVGIWSLGDTLHDVTVSWNILAEAMQHHPMGLLVGSRDTPEKVTDIGIHHNFFMSNEQRNPFVKNNDVRLINNLVYNWGLYALGFSDGITIDIIGNRYRPGPEIHERDRRTLIHVQSSSSVDSPGVSGEPSIHVAGNRSHHHADPEADNWEMLVEGDDFDLTGNPPPRSTRRPSPMAGAAFPIRPDPVDTMEARVLDHAGASHRITADGTWETNRDGVDERLIREYRNGEGQAPSDEQEVGGLPEIAAGTPYDDTDGDGMADTWEDDHGFDSSSAGDGGADADGDGYTNVEEFLNGTDPNGATGPGDGAFGVAPEETTFSDIETFGDRENYEEKSPARWRVLSDRGDRRYGLTTTAFSGSEGRLGEYSIVPGETFGDVEVTAQVRSTENLSENGSADYALILGYVDADNYYYAMFNRNEGLSALFRVEDGERTELAAVDEQVIPDNDYHQVTFSREGERLAMSIDGEQLAEARDGNLGEGAVGVGAFDDSAYFDDIRAEAPDSDPGADAGGDAGSSPDVGSTDTGDGNGGMADDGGDTMSDGGDVGEAPSNDAGGGPATEDGCSCAQSGEGPTPFGLLVVVVFGVVIATRHSRLATRQARKSRKH